MMRVLFLLFVLLPAARCAWPAPTPTPTFESPAKAKLPTGCVFEAHSSLRKGAAINCTIRRGSFTLANLDLDDVWVRIIVPDDCKGPVSMTFGPNRLRAGPSEKVENGEMVRIDPTACPFDRSWVGDTFDGDFHIGDPGSFEAVRDDACDGNETWRDDRFVHIPGRPVSDAFGECASAGHNAFMAWNVGLLDMTMAADGDHGELWEFGPSRPGAVSVEMTYSGLDLVQEGVPAANTALLWLGSGDGAGFLRIDNLTIQDSRFLAEPGPKGARPVSRLIGTANAKISRLVFTNNRLGGGGAGYCFMNDGAGQIPYVVWRGNTHIPDGRPIGGFDGYAKGC